MVVGHWNKGQCKVGRGKPRSLSPVMARYCRLQSQNQTGAQVCNLERVPFQLVGQSDSGLAEEVLYHTNYFPQTNKRDNFFLTGMNIDTMKKTIGFPVLGILSKLKKSSFSDCDRVTVKMCPANNTLIAMHINAAKELAAPLKKEMIKCDICAVSEPVRPFLPFAHKINLTLSDKLAGR